MLTFFKLVPEALDPMRADKAALGCMPLDAFRYCEPMRQASSYGWYVFAPISFDLAFDGLQIRYRISEDWEVLTEAYLPNYIEHWATIAPSGLGGLVPPFLRALHSPRGAIQVWSGYLVSSAAGWSTCIRGLPNQFKTNQYHHYEGIVETDTMLACPLFSNIQLVTTKEVIRISHDEPLFQIQPIVRTSYSSEAHEWCIKTPELNASEKTNSMNAEDWKNFRSAVRTDELSETHRVGDYGADIRRRAKNSSKL